MNQGKVSGCIWLQYENDNITTNAATKALQSHNSKKMD